MRFQLRAVAGDAAIKEAALIKLDIINEVVNRTGITKTKAEMAVETVFESMKRALGKGERIELRGFGIFNVRPRKTGIGRNPRTGAEVAIPPGKAVRFKPGKELQTLAVSTAACPTNGYSSLPAASRTLTSGMFDVPAGSARASQAPLLAARAAAAGDAAHHHGGGRRDWRRVSHRHRTFD